MNPKVRIIIEEMFPKIVDNHVRTRPPPERTIRSLERYRAMGRQVISHLPPEEQEENRIALDRAFDDSVKKLEEFHGRMKSASGVSVSEDAPDAP